jgi:hypothetical protein
MIGFLVEFHIQLWYTAKIRIRGDEHDSFCEVCLGYWYITYWSYFGVLVYGHLVPGLDVVVTGPFAMEKFFPANYNLKR